MKVLVAGGSGFLGSYVVDQLADRGHNVTICDRRAPNHAPGRARFEQGNILDAGAVGAAVAGQDVVYNFAGLADLDDAKWASQFDLVGKFSLRLFAKGRVLRRVEKGIGIDRRTIWRAV